MRIFAMAGFFTMVAAQYGPDPDNTPPEFMCAWRKLAAKYAKINRPDAEAKTFDALQLSKYCKGAVRPAESALPAVFPPPRSSLPSAEKFPAGAVFVDAERGAAGNAGTEAAPLTDIQAAVTAACAQAGATKSVVLRNGTYYLSKTVQIPADCHGLTIAGAAGEAAWVSGGTNLAAIKWVAHNLTHGMNIWKADLSKYGLKAIPGLRVNGRRVSPARYPNADPEATFWPVGYMTSKESRPCAGFNVSCGTRAPCRVGCGARWKDPAIAPKPNKAQTVRVNDSALSRNWDVQFTHYSGGIGGTCAIYDPPFSFWCPSPPFVGVRNRQKASIVPWTYHGGKKHTTATRGDITFLK